MTWVGREGHGTEGSTEGPWRGQMGLLCRALRSPACWVHVTVQHRSTPVHSHGARWGGGDRGDGRILLFSHEVASSSLWPHWLQHVSLPCPSLCPEACSNSGPSSQCCHPTLSSSVTSSPSFPQSNLASGSFPMSRLFTSHGQSIGASASVLPVNIQGWFPLGLTGLISLLSKRISRGFSSTTVWKLQFFSTQPSLWYNSHIHTWLLEKP